MSQPIDEFVSNERVVLEHIMSDFTATEAKLQTDYCSFVDTLQREIAFEEEQKAHLEDLEGMLDEGVVAATRMATEALQVNMEQLIDTYKSKVHANNAFAAEIHEKSKQSVVDLQEIKALMNRMDLKMREVHSFIHEYHTHLKKVVASVAPAVEAPGPASAQPAAEDPVEEAPVAPSAPEYSEPQILFHDVESP